MSASNLLRISRESKKKKEKGGHSLCFQFLVILLQGRIYCPCSTPVNVALVESTQVTFLYYDSRDSSLYQ